MRYRLFHDPLLERKRLGIEVLQDFDNGVGQGESITKEFEKLRRSWLIMRYTCTQLDDRSRRTARSPNDELEEAVEEDIGGR